MPSTEHSLGERYRRACNKRGSDWWSIVFGYPIGRLLAVALERVSFITPNAITLAAFAANLAGAALIALEPSRGGIVAAVVLFQVATVLDTTDGTLARLRASYSKLGAYLDKVTDGIGTFAMCAAVGVRAAEQAGDVWYAVLACAGGAAYLTLVYAYWVFTAINQPPPSQAAVAGVADTPTWRAIGAEWLRGWLRIWKFEIADLYLWISIGALLGEWVALAWLVAGTQVFAATYKIIQRSLILARA